MRLQMCEMGIKVFGSNRTLLGHHWEATHQETDSDKQPVEIFA